jgi:hypothetical protein
MRAASVITGVVCASALLAPAPWERHAFAEDAAPVDASGKLACIAADTDGQALRLKGELRAARRRLKGCSAEACPRMVRDDCLERIRELTRAQPWVIFDATNGHGRVLRTVQVFLDDRLLTERLDGRPIGVDPGDHTFKFRALGRLGGELKLTLREGAWEQHSVVLKTFAPDLVAESDTPVAAPEGRAPVEAAAQVGAPRAGVVTPDARGSEASPTLFDLSSTHGRLEIAAAGIGAVGLAVGSILGALTFSTWHTAEMDCTGGCRDGAARSLASQASTEGVFSTVAFVAGGSALAAGAILWLTDRNSTTSEGLRVLPSVGPDRGQITVRSRF